MELVMGLFYNLLYNFLLILSWEQVSNNGARSAVSKNCFSTELTGPSPGPSLKSVRLLPLTPMESGFYAIDSQCQLRPSEDAHMAQQWAPYPSRQKCIQVWSRGGDPNLARHHGAWVGEIAEEKSSSWTLTLLLHHCSSGNAPSELILCFLNYCSEFLTGNRGRCLGFHAMALPGCFTFFQNEPGKLNTKCMYCCITHPSQTSQLIGVNGVTSYLFSWNEGKRTEIPRLRSASWSWGHTSAAAKRDYRHTDICLCWRQACRKEKMMCCVLNEYLVWRKGLLAAYAGIPKAALNNPAEPWTALWLKQYRVQRCLPAWIFTWIYGFCLLWVCAISPSSSLGTCVQTAVRPFLWRFFLNI